MSAIGQQAGQLLLFRFVRHLPVNATVPRVAQT
jgi:hypothetical protein